MDWRQYLVEICTSRPARRVLRPAWRGAGAIFMLHRFRNPDLGIPGTDPGELGRRLAFLRREGFSFVSLDDLIRHAAGETPLRPRSVAFTVDDGYRDFADVGASVFADYDCPVTVFVTTGFVDGSCWLWWDQVEAAVWSATGPGLDVAVGERLLRYRWSNRRDQAAAAWALFEELKRVPDEVRQASLERLLAQVGVSLPPRPPDRYAPLTWDQIRALEARGVRFGAHTITHPILSQVGADRVSEEIVGSIRRLRTEVRSPSAVFCYPNGDRNSFGTRETGVLAAAGVAFAVSTIHGYTVPFVRAPANGQPIPVAYRVPRFPLPDRWTDFLQIASGFERLKLAFRRAGPWNAVTEAG